MKKAEGYTFMGFLFVPAGAKRIPKGKRRTAIITSSESDMPSKTPKQRRTMAAAAHNPAYAKKMGIPQKVAKEFNRADARKAKRK